MLLWARVCARAFVLVSLCVVCMCFIVFASVCVCLSVCLLNTVAGEKGLKRCLSGLVRTSTAESHASITRGPGSIN